MEETEMDTAPGETAAPPQAPELSLLMVRLLKGVLYREDDERLWSHLLRLHARVRELAGVLLLELVLDEAEGYAFLKSRPQPEQAYAEAHLPRLVARRHLSYSVSLLLALLRRRMFEADASGGEVRLVLSRSDIVQLLQVFLPDGTNEARLVDQVDATIKKVADLGFLRRLTAAAGSAPGQAHYEVRRILKAFVDAQWLSEFDARLAAYRTAQADGGQQGEAGDD